MIYLSPQFRLPADQFDWIHDSFGQMLTPASGTLQPSGVWAADNQAFAGKFDQAVFFPWLESMSGFVDQCLFVTVPDVMGDPVKTRERFDQYQDRIQALGYKTAFVCQPGIQPDQLPDNFDVLFLGGGTDWRMSNEAANLIRLAKRRGLWTHVGAVNSQKRIRHFKLLGVDSVDGTGIIYQPSVKYRRFREALIQKPLMRI